MGKTVAETIKEITRKHLTQDNGLLLGQAITAVGWVNNTVPDCENIIELPMSDVSNMGIACGAAISGRRPIIVIRFQDFIWLNSSPLVNYAAKAKDILGTSAPIFVRLLAMENAGCTHSAILHNLFMYMPGFRVRVPMTPLEYQKTWEEFRTNDDPMIVSEHRNSFQNTDEISDIVKMDAKISVYAISSARLTALQAVERLNQEGIHCNFINLVGLKPFDINKRVVDPLKNTKKGIVIDSGFEIAGAAQAIAFSLTKKTGCFVDAMGIEDRSVGVAPHTYNGTPSVDNIIRRIKNLL